MPETYFINPGVNEKRLIEIMYDEFNRKVTSDMYIMAEKLIFILKI
jgi:cell division protein YceG involved in septum cleavage